MPDGANHSPLSQSPTSRRASWAPIRKGRTPTGPILRHGPGSATTGWPQNGQGPAKPGGLKAKSAPQEPHLAGISWLGGASPAAARKAGSSGASTISTGASVIRLRCPQ